MGVGAPGEGEETSVTRGLLRGPFCIWKGDVMAMRIPPNLFARGGVWYVKRVIRGERYRESTGVKVGGDAELRLAMQRQRTIEANWAKEAAGGKVKKIPTFGEWWLTYHEAYSPKKADPGADATIARHAIAKWQRFRLTDITKSMCESHLQLRLKDASQGTVNRERGLLQAVFGRAIDDHLLEHNPFKGIQRVKDAVRDRVLAHDEQAQLMKVFRPRDQRWLLFMLGTGLRLAEARAVLSEHVDRAEGLLEVQAEAAKFGKGRMVPVFPEVADAIDQQQQSDGKLWHNCKTYYRELLGDASKGLGMPHLHPHVLRHTFATRYLQAGGNIFILSKILGHASVAITEKQYVHLVKTDLVERSRGLDLGLK